MTGAALTADGFIRIKPALGIFIELFLRMGIVAKYTTLIIIYVYIRFLAMISLFQFLPDLIMAGYAFFIVKEIRQFFIYITGIRMEVHTADLFVTVYT
jgi:hypothetical protein